MLETSSAACFKRWLGLRLSAARIDQLLATWLVLLPPLLGAYFIRRYGVNVLYWDDWRLAGLLDKWATGTLTLADLWAQQNEHRILFSGPLLLALWHWTQLDTRACLWATWVTLCLIAAVLYLLFASITAERRMALLRFIPISWLLFSWRQFENLLSGIQITVAVMVLCLVCSIYLLDKSKRLDRYYWLALVSGVVGSFSFANGLLIWPIGLVQISAQHYLSQGRFTKGLRWRASVWSLVGVAVYALYFWDYQKPSNHPSLLFFLAHPFVASKYLLVYFGNPLASETGQTGSALGVGLMLLLLVGYTVATLSFRQRLPQAAPKFFSLVLFALLSGLTLTLARAGFGGDQAASPRYIIFSSFGLIGSFALVQLIESDTRRHLLQGGLIALVLVGALTSYLQGRYMGRGQWVKLGEAAFILRSYSCQPDDKLLSLYSSAAVVRELAPGLEKRQLNVFSGQPRISCQRAKAAQPPDEGSVTAGLILKPGQTDYALELINNQPVANSGEHPAIDSRQQTVFKLSGWAVDRAAGGPPSHVLISVDGQQDFPAEGSQERLDIALAFNQPAYWHSGFVAYLPTEKLGVGRHLLRLKIVTADRRQYYQAEPAWEVNVR